MRAPSVARAGASATATRAATRRAGRSRAAIARWVIARLLEIPGDGVKLAEIFEIVSEIG